MRTVAIIPARGGSKGIPRKNLIDFSGKPLLAWSILACQKCKLIDSVYVTSDSAEILECAHQYGALPIVRPAEIAGDTASSESALVHAIKSIANSVDTVVFLQATSPLRRLDELDHALQKFKDEQLDSLFSAAKLDDLLIWKREKSGNLASLNYNYLNRGRRQDRDEQFVETGSFYIFKAQLLLETGNRLGGKIGVFNQELWQSFEIDESADIPVVRSLFDHFGVGNELSGSTLSN